MVFTTGGAKVGGPSRKSGPPHFFLGPPNFQSWGGQISKKICFHIFSEIWPPVTPKRLKFFLGRLLCLKNPKTQKNGYTTHIWQFLENFLQKHHFPKIFNPKITFFEPKFEYCGDCRLLQCPWSTHIHTLSIFFYGREQL